MSSNAELLADPLPILMGFASLRRMTGSYPAGHPMIASKLAELDHVIAAHLKHEPSLRIDIIRGTVHLNGVPPATDIVANAQMANELSSLGIDSIHISEGVSAEELHEVAQFLWSARDSEGPTAAQLEARGVRHISLGRLVPLDTSWRAEQWPDAPMGPLDPAYAEALLMAQQTFEQVAAGRSLQISVVRDLVQLLICKVARSNAALGQILAVKQYENLTYCHSVNVSILSLLLAKQVRLDDASTAALVEAALLHDIGKTRIPLDVVKKPGALDKRERKLMEAHTTYGAAILVETEGLRPLTPLVALEHHRSVKGGGYPDLGDLVPHAMSQIVSVADVYEAMTGARSYQAPTPPDRACLVLARLAGDKLNTALVKAFVSAVTFFPMGSVVRTSRGELGVVVETNAKEPLHPVLMLVDENLNPRQGRADTSRRDGTGAYERHIVETVTSNRETPDLRQFFATSAAA